MQKEEDKDTPIKTGTKHERFLLFFFVEVWQRKRDGGDDDDDVEWLKKQSVNKDNGNCRMCERG